MLKSPIKLRGTTELGDNSLWVCHYEPPLHPWSTVSIKILTRAALITQPGLLIAQRGFWPTGIVKVERLSAPTQNNFWCSVVVWLSKTCTARPVGDDDVDVRRVERNGCLLIASYRTCTHKAVFVHFSFTDWCFPKDTLKRVARVTMETLTTFCFYSQKQMQGSRSRCEELIRWFAVKMLEQSGEDLQAAHTELVPGVEGFLIACYVTQEMLLLDGSIACLHYIRLQRSV